MMRLRPVKQRHLTSSQAKAVTILTSCLMLICHVGKANGEAETPEAVGDVELGAYLSATCSSCHNKSTTTSGIPSIDGLTGADFTSAINAYKSGERDNATMQAIAASLSDSDIAALVAYFESKRRSSNNQK